MHLNIPSLHNRYSGHVLDGQSLKQEARKQTTLQKFRLYCQRQTTEMAPAYLVHE